MRFINFAPERGINIVCLAISAAAPILAIGPIVGGAVGLVAAFGLLAAMKYQADPAHRIRQAAYGAVWLIRTFIVAIEQMAYEDVYALRDTLPFGWTACTWAWITPIFMAALDLLAYGVTSARAAALQEAKELTESLSRADERDRERAEKIKQEATETREYQLSIARIQAETERKNAAVAAEATAEAAKAAAEASRKVAEAEAEARKVEAEARRGEAEAKRKAAEDRRKEAEAAAEAERKRIESERKRQEEAEDRRKQQVAEKQRIAAAEADKMRARQEADAEAERKFREQEAEAASASGRIKERFRLASGDERRKIVAEAEAALLVQLGRTPTQQEIGAAAGTSDRTVREYQKERNDIAA